LAATGGKDGYRYWQKYILDTGNESKSVAISVDFFI
jgi:hypothetical protein